MGSINKVILVGHLGRDPDVQTTRDGQRIVRLSAATSDRWRDKTTGEQRQRTEWHRVVIFNERLGDIAERYLTQGRPVYLEGRLQTRKWSDDTIRNRVMTEVVLPHFGGTLALLGTRSDQVDGDADAAEAELTEDVPF